MRTNIVLIFFLALALLAPSVASARISPPEKPPGNFFTQDYAAVVNRSDRPTISDIQQRAFEKNQTPIVVVTISRMRMYGNADSIESFASEWFDRWKIGTGTENKGILLLLSVEDRKARIELGRDWGRKWDDHCSKIMDQVIVPNCKKGNYSEAITAALTELAKMAELGPSVTPPVEPLVDRLLNSKPLTKSSQVPGMIGIVMIVLGGGIFLYAVTKAPPEMRTLLMIVGAILVLLPLISWIILAVGAMAFGKSRGGGGSSGGGYSSGGGFSGGSSGGGGASGSW